MRAPDYQPRIVIRGSKDQQREVRCDDDGVLVLHEREWGWLYLDGAPDDAAPRAWLGERELAWQPSGRHFELSQHMVAYWVGDVTLTIALGDRSQAFDVRVEPERAKAQQRDWTRMLEQLETWLAGISRGREGGRVGAVGERGIPGEFLAEALIPLLSSVERALEAVLRRPYVGRRERDCQVSLRMATRNDRATARWIGRRPDAAQWLLADEIAGPEPYVQQNELIDDLDHPANRYVRWLVDEVLAALDRLHAQLRAWTEQYTKHPTLNQTAAWCEARAAILARHCQRLRFLWRGSRLSALVPEPASPAAMGVLVDHEAYARLARLGQRFLSPRFQLAGSSERDAHGVPTRPSFDLYELWTFYWVQRSLALAFPDWSWDEAEIAPLWDSEATGEGAYLRARGAGELTIWFNRTFGTVPHKRLGKRYRGEAATVPTHYSLSSRRRPDITVCYRSDDAHAAWVVLDAKYRLPGQVGAAMESVHIYRDALWMTEYGGRCRAGLLLVPGCKAHHAWPAPAFHAAHDIGVWPCPPGQEPSREFGARLRAWLTSS